MLFYPFLLKLALQPDLPLSEYPFGVKRSCLSLYIVRKYVHLVIASQCEWSLKQIHVIHLLCIVNLSLLPFCPELNVIPQGIPVSCEVRYIRCYCLEDIAVPVHEIICDDQLICFAVILHEVCKAVLQKRILCPVLPHLSYLRHPSLPFTASRTLYRVCNYDKVCCLE